MSLQIIETMRAPQAVGTYSQAVRAIDAEIRRVFENLQSIAKAAGGSLADVAKLSVYLTDVANAGKVNEIMAQYFSKPFPARAAVGVAQLTRGARVEIDCVLAF